MTVDEMVTVKKSDLEFVHAYCAGLEGMKTLLTSERDGALRECAKKDALLADYALRIDEMEANSATLTSLANQYKTDRDGAEKRWREQAEEIVELKKQLEGQHRLRGEDNEARRQREADIATNAAKRALQGLRDSMLVEDDPSGYFRAMIVRAIVDFDGPKKPPTTDHAHEIGSCTHCDTKSITDPQRPTKPARGVIDPREVIEEPATECDECGQTNGKHTAWCKT